MSSERKERNELSAMIVGIVIEFDIQTAGEGAPEVAVMNYLTEARTVSAKEDTIRSQVFALIQRGDLIREGDRLVLTQEGRERANEPKW